MKSAQGLVHQPWVTQSLQRISYAIVDPLRGIYTVPSKSKRTASKSGLLNLLYPFCLRFRNKFFFLYEESFMGARADFPCIIPSAHLEGELPPLHSGQARFGINMHADRRCRCVADIQARATVVSPSFRNGAIHAHAASSIRAIIAGVANTGREPLRMAAAVVALVTRITAWETAQFPCLKHSFLDETYRSRHNSTGQWSEP